MIENLAEAANADAHLVRAGANVSMDILVGVGDDEYIVAIDEGCVASVHPKAVALESGVFAVRAAADVWEEHWRAMPKRDYHDLFSMISAGLARVDGDLRPLMQNLLYFKGLLEAPRAKAEAPEYPAPPAVGEGFEPMLGRYFTLDVEGRDHRIYVEEAGQGIPLVCLHTAGSDGRQFRHLMCDPAITDHYRVIAFDMPWHGKSNPPAGWQEETYQLTTDGYKKAIRAFCAAMELDRPVIMGCSMGGRVVLHLALDHAEEFRAVIALEGADRLKPYYDTGWLNRPDVHGGRVCAGFVSGQVAPQSPDEYRWETLWHYMQSGPGIFGGDLYFYWQDGHFDDRSHQIDTGKCPVYLLSGEYDSSCTPERSEATHARIKGSKLNVMQGIGHFPMSENPGLFRTHILPVLDEIRG